MSVEDARALEEQAWKGPLASGDKDRLADLLANAQSSRERWILIMAAGRGHATTLRPQIEQFLSPEYGPLVFAEALATLTSWWALEREYRNVILAAVQGYSWDIDQDVRLRALMVAPQLLRKQPDRELLEATIVVAELPAPDPDEEGSAYIEGAKDKALVTLREVLTPNWRDLPSPERYWTPEGAEAANLLVRAKQMLSQQRKA